MDEIFISICVSIMLIPIIYVVVKALQVIGEDLSESIAQQEQKAMPEPFTFKDYLGLALLVILALLIGTGLAFVFLQPPQ